MFQHTRFWYLSHLGKGPLLTLMKDYMNLSWVRWWDRKIHPEDHLLASRGLPRDDKWWSRRTDFSIPSSHKYWIIFLAHNWIQHFFYLKKRAPISSLIRWYGVYNIMTSFYIRNPDRVWKNMGFGFGLSLHLCMPEGNTLARLGVCQSHLSLHWSPRWYK